jgi:group I intron endonuclease
MKYCVYCHTNKLNNKKYIGITRNIPERRWQNGRGYINNDHFYRAITKYGWHNFTHEILYTDLSKSEAENLEILLIKEYDSANPKHGYNIELGGNSTDRITDVTRDKISKALKGHECSAETRLKISIANKGKTRAKRGKMTEEQREKNRLCHLGQIPWNKGRAWSDEEKAKCGGKSVYCVELDKVYRTAHEASKDLHIDFSSICKCAKGKVKRAGGYHWKYSEANQ